MALSWANRLGTSLLPVSTFIKRGGEINNSTRRGSCSQICGLTPSYASCSNCLIAAFSSGRGLGY
jgi:hypothetical protein